MEKKGFTTVNTREKRRRNKGEKREQSFVILNYDHEISIFTQSSIPR